MELLATRRGLLADHCSTSHELLAIYRPLDAQASAAVSRLLGRACPTTRRLTLLYYGDWSNLPGGMQADEALRAADGWHCRLVK